MYCTVCGQPVDEAVQFCSTCGARVSPPVGAVPLAPGLPTPTSDLTRLSHLLMVWDRLSSRTSFEFQDPMGRPLGTAQGEAVFPLKYTLSDETGRLVLVLDAQRVRGLLYDFLIHDASGVMLASLRIESSVMSRKYGISVGGKVVWQLTTNATSHHCQIEDANDGRVLATGDRPSSIRTVTTTIAIMDEPSLDHRIVLGAMILASYLAR